MGGTTAKAGLVLRGQPRITHHFEVSGKGSFGVMRAGSGLPVKTPVVDLAEVGRGRRQHRLGRRHRRAAGRPAVRRRRPGPACYGRGGTEPTVTDANLVLGYLDPAGLADGVHLDMRGRRKRLGHADRRARSG